MLYRHRQIVLLCVCDCLYVAMTDQDKLEAVVNLEDKIITLKKNTIEVKIVVFEEGNRLSEVFEEADASKQ
jgi:hypothetical protein